MKKELAKMTVKELRELAKERNVVGRWNMSKDELIVALSTKATRTTEDYLKNIEPGTLVAFQRKEGAISGKFVSFENGKIIVETKKGTAFKLNPEKILWVKTGDRWPKWVFTLFNNQERGEVDALS